MNFFVGTLFSSAFDEALESVNKRAGTKEDDDDEDDDDCVPGRTAGKGG